MTDVINTKLIILCTFFSFKTFISESFYIYQNHYMYKYLRFLQYKDVYVSTLHDSKYQNDFDISVLLV